MRKKWFTALCCVMAAGLIGAIGAFITPKTDVKAEETEIYTWPTDYMVNKSEWYQDKMCWAIESNDKTVWPKATMFFNDGAVDKSKVTYTRNGISESVSVVMYERKGLNYRFDGTVITDLGNTPIKGDKLQVADGFTFTLNENADNDGIEKWTNRTYKYAEALSFTYNGSSWVKDCSVTFIAEDTVFYVANVTGGNCVSAPQEKPVKDGYTFIGWKNGNVFYDFSSAVSADVTLTACFIENGQIASETFTAYSTSACAFMGGKTFTWLINNPTDSVIKKQNGGILTSSPYGLSVVNDSVYDENAGVSTSTSGTRGYQTYGYPEVNFCGYPAPVERGFEGILSSMVEVSKIPLFSVEVGYQPPAYGGVNDNYAEYHVDGKPFRAYLYAYGTDENGAAKQVSKEIKFGMGYFTTAIFDLSDSGLKYVERFAVSANWADVSSWHNNNGHSAPNFYFANIKFGTAETAATETKFTADDNGVYFYNGACLSGDLNSLDDVYYSKIFRAQIGYDGIAQGGYAYSTQRIFAGQYATLVFRNPVKASDYKYLDTSIIAWPQDAENSFLAETSKEFTFKALRYDAATVDGENCVTVNANYKKIKNFRIPLADYADDNGYVTKIVFYYAGTEAERTAEEAKKYSINMAFRDFTLTNAEQTVGAVKTMNLLLNGKIETRFGVELKDETQKNNAYLSVKVGNEEERRLTFADAEKSENGKYYFNIGIAAAQMTENIAVRVITADADSEIQNFTVRKYADYLLKKESSSAELKNLITAMLDYGAYAQVYFGVNTDKLANAGLHENGENPLDGVTISQSIKTEGSIDGLTDINADMLLQADNTLRLYFKTRNADDYNITVKYNDGKDRTFTLVYAEDTTNGRYYVDIPHIPAPMLGTEYEITFKTADATLKVTLSGYSYAATLIADNSTEAQTNVAKALYLYGEAAANYFKSI